MNSAVNLAHSLLGYGVGSQADCSTSSVKFRGKLPVQYIITLAALNEVKYQDWGKMIQTTFKLPVN